MKDKVTPTNDPRQYVGYDLLGYPFNSKYPPNKALFGNSHEGYASKGEGVLLYDYAVMGYDVIFTYRGETYYLLNDGEGVLSDKTFSLRKQVFSNPMELIEKFTIDGIPLIKLAPQIEHIEPV